MIDNEFLRELEKQRENNLIDLKKILEDTFNLQKIENINGVKHGCNAGRTLNLKARILTNLSGVRVSKHNINSLIFDFDNFEFFIYQGYFILKLCKKKKEVKNGNSM